MCPLFEVGQMELTKCLTLGYLLKNIPIPLIDTYMKMLIEKTHIAIDRFRWIAYHYLRKGEEEDNRTDKNHYGIKCRKSPSHVAKL